MRAARTLFFSIVVALFSFFSLGGAFLLGRSLSPHEWPARIVPQAPSYELARAIAPQGLQLSGSDNCVPPTDTEIALVKAAVGILEFPYEMSSSLGTGAERLLSSALRRWVDGEFFVVCDDRELLYQAQKSIEARGRLLRARLVEYGFALIFRLPDPSEDLVRKVAESAFNEHPQESDLFRRDLRPLARATLAAIDGASVPYTERAFSEITIEDSMGTGAAQIAVAGGHPKALEKVELLMGQLLAALPSEVPIPWHQRNRLYEMAQALAYGGPSAREHVAPLRELMGREVESNATMFGMIALPPRRMCPILDKILQVPIAEAEYGYCDPNADDFTLEN